MRAVHKLNHCGSARANLWRQGLGEFFLDDLQGLRAHHLAPGRDDTASARMSAANVAFDDHPNDQRFTDRIETVTADSVFQWLQRAGLAAPMQVQR